MREDSGCRWRDEDGVCRCAENPYAPFTCPWAHPGRNEKTELYLCPDWEEVKE